MRVDRAERTGFGASIAGHLLLVGLLAAGYLTVRPMQPPKRQSIEVDLISETALESGAPEISQDAPAPKLSDLEAPIEPEPLAKPVIEPVPAPVPRPVARQPAKAAPMQASRPQPKAQDRPARSGGSLRGLLKGLTDDSGGRATAPPAAALTPAVQSALAAAVRRQLKPYWKAPTGADAELLRTELAITLARDGSVQDIELLRQTGVTPSNRTQAKLHQEQAYKAVRLASPFQLPAQYYDAWKILKPIGFDKRLSQ